MPRYSHGKKRKDGRYVRVCQGKYFYGGTPEEAQAKADEYRQRKARGLDPIKERVSDYAREWLPVNRAKVCRKTYELYEYFVELLINELGETTTIAEVKPSDIKRIYTKRFGSASDSHIRHFRSLITSMFDSAWEDGYCRYNPARSKKAAPHRGTAGTHRVITDWERELIHSVPHRVRPVAMAMLYAGLRDGEALALDVGRDVDFKAGVIHVRWFRHADHNHAVISNQGKTPAAKRDVPLLPELEEVIRDIPGLLISMEDGSVLTKSAWCSAWRSYKNEMEVKINGCRKRWYGKRKVDSLQTPPPWREFTVRPYDLRHSWCSALKDRSIDSHVLQLWMGHTSPELILKIYDHVSEERIRTEVEKLHPKQDQNRVPEE